MASRYLDAGDAPAAVGHAEAAVRLDPEYSAAWKALGRALTAAGRDADALIAYERGAKVAERRGDQQAAKEMRVFSKRLRRDAEKTLETYEQAMAKAQDEAHALLAEVQNRLQAEAAERQAEINQQLAEQLTDAEAQIAAARKRALTEMAEAAVEAARAATERLAGVQVSEEAARTAMRSVLEETR